MKMMIGSLLLMSWISAAVMMGCNDVKKTPSGPAGSGQSGTGGPTATAVPAATATPQTAQTAVNLGSAGSFVVLAGSAVASSGPTTLCGNLGISPGNSLSGTPFLSCGGEEHLTDTIAATAQGDLATAYDDAAFRTAPATVTGDLGGQRIYPGLYKSSSSLEITSGDLTLDALGDPNGVFIFQIISTLTTASGRQVHLAGGAKASNVFWQVGSFCFLNPAAIFKGTIIAHGPITLSAGTLLEGRALSETDQVILSSNTVTEPAP